MGGPYPCQNARPSRGSRRQPRLDRRSGLGGGRLRGGLFCGGGVTGLESGPRSTGIGDGQPQNPTGQQCERNKRLRRCSRTSNQPWGFWRSVTGVTLQLQSTQ